MIDIKVGSKKAMIKIKNPNSGEERTINKVLGDEDTLAKAQEHAGYYDMHNNHFIPQMRLLDFVTPKKILLSGK